MFKHKNALAALMAVVMLFSLTACGGSKQEASTGDNSQTEQPAEAPAESQLTETVNYTSGGIKADRNKRNK